MSVKKDGGYKECRISSCRPGKMSKERDEVLVRFVGADSGVRREIQGRG